MTNSDDMVRAVIFDWAGTLVDFGSRAPVRAFVELFRGHGIAISEPEARGPMGLAKRTHLAQLLAQPRIAEAWRSLQGAPPDDAAVNRLYTEFVELQSALLTQHADVIPGVLETIDELRARGVKVGSTTGYSRSLMSVLEPAAGLSIDVVIAVDDVPQGRPAPWMALLAAQRLGTYPIRTCVKVGDTLADIAEGRNAGMWTVGVTETGNEVGLSQHELASLPREQRQELHRHAEARLRNAGAHYVIAGVAHLSAVLAAINDRLTNSERP